MSDRYIHLSCILVLEEIGENSSRNVTFCIKQTSFRRTKIVFEEIESEPIVLESTFSNIFIFR